MLMADSWHVETDSEWDSWRIVGIRWEVRRNGHLMTWGVVPVRIVENVDETAGAVARRIGEAAMAITKNALAAGKAVALS